MRGDHACRPSKMASTDLVAELVTGSDLGRLRPRGEPSLLRGRPPRRRHTAPDPRGGDQPARARVSRGLESVRHGRRDAASGPAGRARPRGIARTGGVQGAVDHRVSPAPVPDGADAPSTPPSPGTVLRSTRHRVPVPTDRIVSLSPSCRAGGNGLWSSRADGNGPLVDEPGISRTTRSATLASVDCGPTQIANLETRLIRWMVGTVIATATLTVGILRFLG